MSNLLIRRLTRFLFISGAINILLIVFVIYWLIKERPPTPYYELKPADKKEQQAPLAFDHTNAEVLKTLRQLPLEQLVAKLKDSLLVENGYTLRDLAIGCMVSLYHFDLQKALLGLKFPEQERKIAFGRSATGKPLEITVYPGLSEEHFLRVVNYANMEKWPLTSKGLYLSLKRFYFKGEEPPESLVDSFLLTPEYLAVEMLFNRAPVAVERKELITLLSEGNWSLLTQFAEQQRLAQDLNPARRQKFLLDYIEHGSKKAAYLILKTDAEFATHKLNDRHVLLLLRLLQVKVKEAESFAISQLSSPRSNAVWKMAAKRLYQYAGELPPATYQHHAALERFVRQKTGIVRSEKVATVAIPPGKPTIVKKIVHVTEKPLKTHLVQEGDSLWKISRRYKVDLEKLKKANRLTSDRLKPGMNLKIPTS